MVTKKITLAAGKQEFGVCGLEKNEKQHEHQEQLASSPSKSKGAVYKRISVAFLSLTCQVPGAR